MSRIARVVVVAGLTTVAALAVPAGASESLRQPAAASPGSEPARSAEVLKKYQLGKESLAIEGYDPVAYFPEGDPKGKGAAIKGDKKIEVVHNGVRYRFSSTKNRDLFLKAPQRYEPAHGGWCSYAAAKATYTEPSPKNFIVEDGRLFLFYKDLITDTRSLWKKEGAEQLEKAADAFWKTESGEDRRAVGLDDQGNPVDLTASDR